MGDRAHHSVSLGDDSEYQHFPHSGVHVALFKVTKRATISNRYNQAPHLTHISLASFLWDIGKECIPRSDAAERGV